MSSPPNDSVDQVPQSKPRSTSVTRKKTSTRKAAATTSDADSTSPTVRKVRKTATTTTTASPSAPLGARKKTATRTKATATKSSKASSQKVPQQQEENQNAQQDSTTTTDDMMQDVDDDNDQELPKANVDDDVATPVVDVDGDIVVSDAPEPTAAATPVHAQLYICGGFDPRPFRKPVYLLCFASSRSVAEQRFERKILSIRAEDAMATTELPLHIVTARLFARPTAVFLDGSYAYRPDPSAADARDDLAAYDRLSGKFCASAIDLSRCSADAARAFPGRSYVVVLARYPQAVDDIKQLICKQAGIHDDSLDDVKPIQLSLDLDTLALLM